MNLALTKCNIISFFKLCNFKLQCKKFVNHKTTGNEKCFYTGLCGFLQFFPSLFPFSQQLKKKIKQILYKKKTFP